MAKNPKKASTQEHLDIDDIVDDLVVLKTGWVAQVMSTTAVNFDLLSEAEQDATIYAYGAFLNSLSFPLEILIRSKKADITSYFQSLEEAEASQPNPDLKRQIQKYKDFIQSTVQQKTVLDKKFYLIINYSPAETGFKALKGKKTAAKSKHQLIEDAKTALVPKRDHIIKQTSRLGLTTRQLTTQELIELFYDIYNPAPTGTQRVLLDTSSYTTPIVEPAVEIPSPAPQTLIPQNNTPLPQNQFAQQPNIAPANFQTESLRPVTAQPQPDPQPQQTFAPNPNLAPHQNEALVNLQQATAKASQLVTNASLPPVTAAPTQNQPAPAPAYSSFPGNPNQGRQQ